MLQQRSSRGGRGRRNGHDCSSQNSVRRGTIARPQRVTVQEISRAKARVPGCGDPNDDPALRDAAKEAECGGDGRSCGNRSGRQAPRTCVWFWWAKCRCGRRQEPAERQLLLVDYRLLRKHEDAVHFNIRNFGCELCAKRFSVKNDLTDHVLAVHSKVRLKTNCMSY